MSTNSAKVYVIGGVLMGKKASNPRPPKNAKPPCPPGPPKIDWDWWKKQVALGLLPQVVYLRAKRKERRRYGN